MDRVYATVNEGMAQYLSTKSQMDDMLKKGASLYVEHEDGSTELLATPEDGYLFPIPEMTIKVRTGGVSID